MYTRDSKCPKLKRDANAVNWSLTYDAPIVPMLKALVVKSVKPLNIAVIPYGITAYPENKKHRKWTHLYFVLKDAPCTTITHVKNKNNIHLLELINSSGMQELRARQGKELQFE